MATLDTTNLPTYNYGDVVPNTGGQTAKFDTKTGAPLTPPITPPLTPPVNPQLPPASTVGSGFNIDTTSATTKDISTPTAKTDSLNYAQRLQEALSSYNKSRDSIISGTDFTGMDVNIASAKQNLLGINQSERQGLQNIEQKAIPMEFITGQQAAVSRQGALDRLAASENLQALTGIKQTAIDSLKLKLGFEDTRFEKLLGVESALQGLDKQAKTDARQTLSDILDFTKGQAFEELDPQSQQSIINATAQSPYSLGQVQQAMQRNKVAIEDERAKNKGFTLSEGQIQYKYNSTTGQYDKIATGNPKTVKTVGDLSPAVATKVQAQSSAYESAPIVKNYNEVQNKAVSVQKIIDSGVGGPGDLALVFEFMKALDPNSVVKETEYATAAKSGNIFAGVFSKFNGYLKEKGGFLPEAVKKSFQELTNQKFATATQQYDNFRQEKARIINKYTGMTDGSDYLVDYSGGGNQTPTSSGNVIQTKVGNLDLSTW